MLASIPTRVVGLNAIFSIVNLRLITVLRALFFSGEESTVEPQQIEGSVRTRRKQGDCVSRAVSSYLRLFYQPKI